MRSGLNTLRNRVDEMKRNWGRVVELGTILKVQVERLEKEKEDAWVAWTKRNDQVRKRKREGTYTNDSDDDQDTENPTPQAAQAGDSKKRKVEEVDSTK